MSASPEGNLQCAVNCHQVANSFKRAEEL